MQILCNSSDDGPLPREMPAQQISSGGQGIQFAHHADGVKSQRRNRLIGSEQAVRFGVARDPPGHIIAC